MFVGETSEAIGDRTQRDTRRAGALMANTNSLFGASAGEFTRHVMGHDLTSRLRCQINSEGSISYMALPSEAIAIG